MPSFFIVGSARSGTTMVRLLMNAHPEVVVPPESRFIVELWPGRDEVGVESWLERLARHPQFRAWRLPVEGVARELPPTGVVRYAEAVEAAYRGYARARAKGRWGDKTPRYIEHIPFLARLFPGARFVHVVRDGRDVALSYADTPFGPKTVARAARLWARRVHAGRAAGRTLPADRYLEIRYEDLVASEEGFEERARALCRFLGLAFDPAMLSYGEVAAAEALDKARQLNPLVTSKPVAGARSWREQMARRDVAVFEAVAGDILSQLGYERWFVRPGARARIAAELGLRVPVGRLRAMGRPATARSRR